MIKCIIVFFIILLGTGCTVTLPAAPAAPTATPLLSPTVTPAIASTSTLLPTVAITSTPAPLPTGKEILFEESGDVKFAGTRYGEGETAIILANMSVGGEKQWDPFVAAVGKQKFTTVTFDYRNINEVGPDMVLILGWLKEQGFGRVICIGASLGTQACSVIAREPQIVGMVLIAGSVHHASVAETTYPKLFISGTRDAWAIDIKMGYERAAEPKKLVLFEDNPAHGTNIFSSSDAKAFLTLLIDFVNGLAAP